MFPYGYVSGPLRLGIGGYGAGSLTVAAGLYRCLDVPDALHRDAVLIVAIDVLIFELADLVDEDAELVGDIRDILIASLTPGGELLLR